MTEIPRNIIPVLDHGYVAYIQHMGSDLSVVNGLRASMMRRSSVLREADKKLLARCFRKREFSAWRHAAVTLEVKAPLMVARQLYKYSVGSSQREDQFGWNEASRRYVRDELEFYNPIKWRSAPTKDVKQGSGPPIAESLQFKHHQAFAMHSDAGICLYQQAIDDGICVEQARGYLSAYFMYVTWQWTMSLNTFFLIAAERLPDEAHAQIETREYALAILDVLRPMFPFTVGVVEESLYG